MNEQAQRAAVATEALSWLGTAYHHHGRIKGVGVDCAMLLAEVFESRGLVPRVEAGAYPVQWHLHRGEERFISWLSRYARLLELDELPQLGDVALFQYGRCFSHGSILVDVDQVVHAYVNRGVILSRFNEDPLHGRPVQFWTLWGK